MRRTSSTPSIQASRADWTWDAVAAEADEVSEQLESEIRETDPDLIARSERLLAGTLGNGAFHAMTHFGWLVDAEIGVDRIASTSMSTRW